MTTKRKKPSPKRKTKAKKKATKPALSADQIERIAALGKLGFTVTPADVARILELPETVLTSYLESPRGREVWAKARAESRAELVTIIRRQALEGSPQAQKLLTTLLDRDDTVTLAHQRIPAAELRELIGRTQSTITARVKNGDMVAMSPDRKYSVGDLIGLIPALWDKLATARKEVSRLQRLNEAGRTEETEARRQLAVEQARRRKRENDVAEANLVQADQVCDQVADLARVVKEQSANLIESIRIALSLEGSDSRKIEDARKVFLRRCAADMEEGVQP